MKYLKWILKNGSKKTVIVWVISVFSGSAALIAMSWLWLIHFWNYIAYQSQPTTTDIVVVSVLALYVLVPGWIGYYFSDRQLFYFEYMNDPNRDN